MRKNVFFMSLMTLIIFGCSPSDDNVKLQSEFQNEISNIDFTKMMDALDLEYNKLNSTSLNKGVNSNTSNKGEDNGNGVYMVPIYSNDIRPNVHWVILWWIPNSNLRMVIDFPEDGDDRALVFSEDKFMANYNIQGPRLFIQDFENWPVVTIKYSNHCDDNRTGIYSMRWKAEYLAVHQDDDGVPDIYVWGQPWQWTDKNGRMHVKTTLTDAHSFIGECPIPTEEVDFSFILQTQNGRPRVEATLDGVTYSL